VPILLFRSPYAAVGGMTIAHGLQYLLLVGLVTGGRGPASSRLLRVALGLNVALVGGVLLSWASHLHASTPPLRVLFGAYVGAVMAHFVVDGSLWRMRDLSARRFLAARVPYLLPGETVSVADRSAGEIG
jgi:hypothetical protein